MGNKIFKVITLIIIMVEVMFYGGGLNTKAYTSNNIVEVVTESCVNDVGSNNDYICNYEFKENNYIRYNEAESDNVFYNYDGKAIERAGAYLRKQMVKREESVCVKINCEYYDGIIKDIYKEAVKYDDSLNSSEGDYLLKHFSRYKCTGEISSDGWTTLRYKVEYLTTASQEDQVNKAVKEALNELKIDNMKEYDKVKDIHDYIVKNVCYDYSYQNYSAYNAIIDKSVVCQGFASLTYKMLKEAGLRTRIITGRDDSGSSHAWNIVCIDGKWYNLDTTWDENLSSRDKKDLCYDYFLLSENDFDNHFRDNEYLSYEFTSKYPISNESYDANLLLMGNVDYSFQGSLGNTYGTILGDVDGNRIVDELDLAMVASRYNLSNSMSGWDKRYDFNNDNIIDIYDIVIVSGKVAA